MKILLVGETARFVVSDAVAHHILAMAAPLRMLQREGRPLFPYRRDDGQVIVRTIRVDQWTKSISAIDYDGDLLEPEDPDNLTDALEEEALTLLHDVGEIYEQLSAEWQNYTREHR